MDQVRGFTTRDIAKQGISRRVVGNDGTLLFE
jgi:hypothetical protein